MWNKAFWKILAILIAFVIITSGIVAAQPPSPVSSSAIIYVPDDYAKIQWAVDNTSAGDTIIVRDGTYYENVNVNKRLTIQSENGSTNCIVQAANPDDHVFEVTADYVNISGFTMMGATHWWNDAGICLYYADYCNISDNNASNNGIGIYLISSDSNILTNNTVLNNKVGYGIYLIDYSYYNKIKNSNISYNKNGIVVERSSNNEIKNNTFVNDGLSVSRSYWNIIENNTVNGKPLVYLEGKSDQKITNAGQVILLNCGNITVENLDLSNISNGIDLINTKNSNIKNIKANSSGIHLSDTSNNNNITNNNIGISLSHSHKNTLMNNIANNGTGIYLHESDDNILTNNIANFNEFGFYIGGSGCKLINNTANSNLETGIRISSSSDCVLINNTANSNHYQGCAPIYAGAGTGIYLSYVTNCSLINNTANSNYGWSGISLESSSSCKLENNTANLNGYYGIALFGTPGPNTVINNNVNLNGRYGILASGAYNCTIIGNNASDNKRRGIYLATTKNNMLIGNNINLNEWDGIYLSSTDYNIIINNTISNNDCGIRLENSNSSIIYLNNFVNNNDNVYSSYSTNFWNSTEPITYQYNGSTFTNYTGNYWDDYSGADVDKDGIGDTPYSIDSDQDYYPLIEPCENYFAPTENIFDTGSPANPYPSISGTHNGTITPTQTITVHKLYTYPCAGTGGHSEYVRIYNETGTLAEGHWNGYAWDYHNISLAPSITLLKDHEYNYTIITGSYPQIIHAKEFNATGGKITCIEFIDANGKRYKDWIPAIRLWG